MTRETKNKLLFGIAKMLRYTQEIMQKALYQLLSWQTMCHEYVLSRWFTVSHSPSWKETGKKRERR